MDMFLQLRQLYMAAEHIERSIRRPPTFRERVSFENLSDDDLRSRFRFGRTALVQLQEKVDNYLPLHTLSLIHI